MDQQANCSRLICDREPDFEAIRTHMEFYLTYTGKILGASRENTRARHKHELRKHFHPQLRQAWNNIPNVAQIVEPTPPELREKVGKEYMPYCDYHAYNCRAGNYQFVPLVASDGLLVCGLEILFLRPGAPGALVESGDIDNRLKTLFDALKRPTETAQLGGYTDPSEDETPFFVLVDNDKLISRISVDTGALLESVTDHENDVRLTIKVTLKPVGGRLGNLYFL